MAGFKYAFQNYDKTKHVRSSLREKTISHKHAREIAVAIKGLSIEKARSYLEDVVRLKRAVAFRRYHNEVGNKQETVTNSGPIPKFQYPKVFLLVIKLESNAEY